MLPHGCKNSGRFIISPRMSTKLEIRTVTMTATSLYCALTVSQTRLYILCLQRQLCAFLGQPYEVGVTVQFISAPVLFTGVCHVAQTAAREANLSGW